jgi:hypothetical protein
MKLQSQICKTALVVLPLSFLAVDTRVQQPSQRQDIVTLSETMHATLYPEVMCGGCIVPEPITRISFVKKDVGFRRLCAESLGLRFELSTQAQI